MVLGGYDFVAFDFDGTLVDFVDEDRVALETVRRQFFRDLDSVHFREEAIAEIIRFHEEVDRGEQSGLEMHRVRLARTVESLAPSSICRIDEITGCYRRALVNACTPLPGAASLLTSLRQKAKPLAVVSNAYDATEQRARIARAFPGIAFEAIVIAAECAAPKPDRAPFDQLLWILGPDHGQGVYVGDQPDHDIPGALRAGLDVVIVSSDGNRRQRSREAGAATVSSLSDLDV